MRTQASSFRKRDRCEMNPDSRSWDNHHDSFRDERIPDDETSKQQSSSGGEGTYSAVIGIRNT